MRRIPIIIISLLLCSGLSAQPKDFILSQEQGRITFALDEVPAPERRFSYATTAEEIARKIKMDQDGGRALLDPPEYVVLYNSFSEAEEMRGVSEDVLFQMLLQAWSQHRPVVLSPDAIWLVISQGLSWYVNAHPEEARRRLVNHEGKQELRVWTNDLFSEQADWSGLISGFTSEIAKYTNNDVAGTLVADFSTTGVDERIVSKITLMDVVKPYFDYTAFYVVCGIPSITLTGTPEDWRNVQRKVRALSGFGLGWWADMLDPVLDEFVKAAEGRPDYWFWKDIVCKTRPRTIQGASCAKNPPPVTKVDGWFLKFFPFDGKGRTDEKVPITKTMMSETVCVPFKYQVMTPEGAVVSETEMELVGGIVGVQEDSATFTLSPKIGWFVRVEKSKYDEAQKNIAAGTAASATGRDPREARTYEEYQRLTMESSLVYWDEGPLTRNDFGIRKSNDQVCDFVYGLDVESSNTTIGNTRISVPSVRAYMDPYKSWINEEFDGERIRTNLQTAFDYIEVCRRRAEQEIRKGSRYDAGDIYRFHLGIADNFLETLAQETMHGQDTATTRYYAQKVKDELESLPVTAADSDMVIYPKGYGESLRIGAGSEFFSGTAASFFSPLVGINFGGDLIFGRVNVLFDMLYAAGGPLRSELLVNDYVWRIGQKLKGGNMEVSLGYTAFDSQWVRMVPFAGIGVGFIDYPGNPGGRTDKSGNLLRTDEISGFRMQAGLASDIKLFRNVQCRPGTAILSEYTLRLRIYAARTGFRRADFASSLSASPYSGLTPVAPGPVKGKADAWSINLGVSLNMQSWLKAR